MAVHVDRSPQGFFSILRYRSDVTRDEAKNLAVLLVSADGSFGGMKAGRVSAASQRLREQGLVDSILVNLADRFQGDARPDLGALRQMVATLERSIYLTEPQPVVVPDVDLTLSALFRSYVATHGGGSRATKGAILDRVVAGLRGRGWSLARSQYVRGFLFDLVIERPEGRRRLGEVLSFASGARKWEQVENDAGHYLYGLERVTEASGLGIIEPPTEDAHPPAVESHRRVSGWFREAGVQILRPEDLIGNGEPPAVQQSLIFVD